MAKVEPTLAVKVKPRRVLADRTRARLVIKVRASGGTPTGKVVVKVGHRKLTGTLRRGKVVIRLPVLDRRGAVTVKVRYAGDRHTLSAVKKVRIRVR